MPASDNTAFPLVSIDAVSNARHAWQALEVRWQGADDLDALECLFGNPDLLAATAPLDCIVAFADPLAIDGAITDLLPAERVILAIPAASLDTERAVEHCKTLQQIGYRFLVEPPLAPGQVLPAYLRAMALDVGPNKPLPAVLALHGPHLARGVADGLRHKQCVAAGFAWFCGDFALKRDLTASPSDGTSRKRLLTLLGLLARDAESRELEALLKQDPALSYHLLKLVNSAAFALSTPITSFGQAINLLGRRQLQRWLQLLLYARQQDDGLPNPLLPLAARRAAQMEMLCKLQGGDREQQDLAFMTGVFSMLDVLFGMPMQDIVRALSLDAYVVKALLERDGQLGAQLRLTESASVSHELLAQMGSDSAQWWRSLLHGYQWAIQVSRNL